MCQKPGFPLLTLPPSVKIYLATFPVDMRKQFKGLATIARHQMELDPFSGYLFVFFNKRRNRMKILFWDRDGYALYCKCLEKGKYTCQFLDETKRRSLSQFELNMILEGIELPPKPRTPRYSLPLTTTR